MGTDELFAVPRVRDPFEGASLARLAGKRGEDVGRVIRDRLIELAAQYSLGGRAAQVEARLFEEWALRFDLTGMPAEGQRKIREMLDELSRALLSDPSNRRRVLDSIAALLGYVDFP